MANAADIFATPYLTPTDMARARRLTFTPRLPPTGLHVGQHASPQVGHAAEFNDYRTYTPGDNPADIDWKVLGRTDRLYVKRFEHQTDMTLTLLIDASASMAYDGGEPTHGKYHAACCIAAVLSVVLLQQHDRVNIAIAQRGLATWHGNIATTLQLAHVLDALHRTPPTDRADLPLAIKTSLHRMGGGGTLMVLSDFVEARRQTLAPLAAHRVRGGEAWLAHVIHPHEQVLPFDRPAVVIDSETGQRVTIDSRSQRRAYSQKMAAYLDQWREAALQAGSHHLPVESHRPALDAISPCLSDARGTARSR